LLARTLSESSVRGDDASGVVATGVVALLQRGRLPSTALRRTTTTTTTTTTTKQSA
jgi:hypothetical protein